MYTLEQLQQKNLKELKEIGWQLSVLPAGDRRCRQNWIDTLAGVNPPLLELLEVSPAAEVKPVPEPHESQALASFQIGDLVKSVSERWGIEEESLIGTVVLIHPSGAVRVNFGCGETFDYFRPGEDLIKTPTEEVQAQEEPIEVQRQEPIEVQAQEEPIEIQRQEPIEIQRQEPHESSPGVEVESVQEPHEYGRITGYLCRPNPIEVQAQEPPIGVQRQEAIEIQRQEPHESSPGVEVESVQEPIEIQATEAHEPASATSLSKVPALDFKAILRADFSRLREMSGEQLLVFSRKAISEPISFQKEHRKLLLEVLDWASLVALRFYLNSTLLYLPDTDSFASAPVNLGIEVNCRLDWLKGRMEYEATQFFPEGKFKTYCDDFSYLLHFVYEHFGFGAVHPGGNITALSYITGFIRYLRTQADTDDPPFSPLQISCPYRVKPIEKFQAQEPIAPAAIFNDEQPPNRGDNGRDRLESEPELSQNAIASAIENSPGVSRKTSTPHQLLELFKSCLDCVPEPTIELQRQEPFEQIADSPPGITFSSRFLARYSPPQSETISYEADACGQLSLLDFEVESLDEPPDHDDFASIDAFQEAIARCWDAENPEPLTVSMTSMCEWVPCPEEWYEPKAEISPLKGSSMLEVLELSSAIESSSTCNFSIPTFDAWCDRANRHDDTDEPPDTGIFARLPKPKPPSFPPQAIGQSHTKRKSNAYQSHTSYIPVTYQSHTIRCIAAGSSSQPARSPPGGDAMQQ